MKFGLEKIAGPQDLLNESQKTFKLCISSYGWNVCSLLVMLLSYFIIFLYLTLMRTTCASGICCHTVTNEGHSFFYHSR